ncbi:Gfo/Idh/MocA family protein [Agathobaculum sp.]|uniref:Gfo/Idh/MocA family protein n=1 Tax=Agathobaculum sp. TaxID=2048138 RepID=UPI002A7F7856|nr:Gfo/Idh/MocA family oxidoreductase [Agathobaculum sp.]MDY3619000.1 Gfo/Idh/MocA family oxidoreductase [Agathobaculum sp.]
MGNELKIGIVGTGAIGRTHIERINSKLSGAKVIACADANLDFCKSVAEKYGIKPYATGEEMIAAPDVDAVIVTTLDPFHAQYVLAAIAAGKPVFCEKPLAPEAETCKKIVEAEMASGRHLVQVGFMRRYDTGYRQLKEAIASKKYGEPLLLHCAHRNPSVPLDYDTPMEVENSMIHEIDVLRWLLGEDYATAEVRYGKKCRRAGENLQDPQVMILTTKSGVRIDVEAFVTTGHCYQIKCEVVCEDGILNLPESPTINVCACANIGHEIDSDWSTRFAEAYDTEFQEWIDATKAGRVDGPTAWDGYAGQVAAAAASKARDTQTIVPVKYDPMPAFYQK